jgi:hypothetical protein
MEVVIVPPEFGLGCAPPAGAPDAPVNGFAFSVPTFGLIGIPVA